VLGRQWFGAAGSVSTTFWCSSQRPTARNLPATSTSATTWSTSTTKRSGHHAPASRKKRLSPALARVIETGAYFLHLQPKIQHARLACRPLRLQLTTWSVLPRVQRSSETGMGPSSKPVTWLSSTVVSSCRRQPAGQVGAGGSNPARWSAPEAPAPTSSHHVHLPGLSNSKVCTVLLFPLVDVVYSSALALCFVHRYGRYLGCRNACLFASSSCCLSLVLI
jgi:hypothetical protein